eukprot:g12693.t1
MPGERRPRRWAAGAGGGSGSPSSSRRISPASSSSASNIAPPQRQQRWGSNLSTQRRERAVVWASCLQKVQALRRGGSWQRVESGTASNVATVVGDGDDACSTAGEGVDAAVAQDQQRVGVGDQLEEQLDILTSLTYPNSSISSQDAGFMVSALCEAVPRSSVRLSARVARLFVSLCAKQQKVTFLAWQLNIVLDFLVGSLAPTAVAEPPTPPPPPPSPSSLPSPSDRRDCARALAQLLYENGERLGTRFDDVIPPLLGLADPSAVDLETKHAALDALTNLSLKNWPGFTETQRQAVCSCLTRNFVEHWRAFPSSSPPDAAAVSSAATGGGAAAERKVLASATRGLACAVSKSAAAAVLGPYLARVVHALNHLVQPAEGAEKAAAAAQGFSGGGGGSRSTSGSRSWSRSSRGFGGHGGSGGGGGGGGGGSGSGMSPTRSSASASLSDPRARVRLQALTLLESMAAKDAKSLYPHWALFLPPYVPGVANGGGGGGDAAAVSGVPSGGSNPVLPAGLLTILEDDDAPQVRAAAAGAAASLVKNAPLRKWMLLLQPPTLSPGTATASAGGGVVGIGERVESMMLRLHQSLVGCLAREKSPAVVAKLCACSGALTAEMPYATVELRGGSTTGDPERAGGTGGGGGGSGGRAGVEESLGDLLRALARLAMDVAAEPRARIAASQALTAAFSTKEPIAAIDSFLSDFRCPVAPSCGTRTPPLPSSMASAALFAARGSSISTPGAGLGGWSPLPLRAGSADDRGNRFAVGGARNNNGGDGAVRSQQPLKPSPAPLGRRERSREAGDGASRHGGGAERAGGGGGGGLGREAEKVENAGGSDSDQMPPPLPRGKVDDAAAATTTPACGASSGASGSGESFVDRLIALAGAPGQLRAEALGLLTRIGRSYPAHLSGGGGDSGSNGSSDAPKTTWERVSALLLRCFADPDQNLRLHALKVLEALLLARAEQAAAAVAARAKASTTIATAAAAPAPAENMSSHRPPRSRLQDSEKESGWDGRGATGGLPQEDRGVRAPQHHANADGGKDGTAADGMAAEGDEGSELWEDLVQKHLQRALEDPYHGVRAVACSCHACLLESDWEAFSDQERDRCLDRVLAATRDRTAGVNILACRVVAGVMTMAGQDGAAKWCRDPEFLGRCAARLQEMMEDPKATIRAQAMLAVGNLSCSLHSIRSRHPRSTPPALDDPPPTPTSPRLDNSKSATNTPSPSSFGRSEPSVFGPAAPVVSPGELVPRPRLRSLCSGALRLTATEPDHAAGSAVRALGYLAWGLDPANNSSRGNAGGEDRGGLGEGGKRCANSVPLSGRGGVEVGHANGAAAPAAAVGAAKMAGNERGRQGEGTGGVEDDAEGEEDRSLQDKTVLALSTRLALEKESPPRGGGGGGVWGSGGDRRAELAAAKCRWNCCIALGVVLSAPGVQARVAEAPWAPDLMRSLGRAVVEDGHLKVRTHAAHALRNVRDARRACGDQLRAILGGALRGFRDCKQRSIVADATQMRYIGDLEAALLSLLLHVLLALVLDGNYTSAAGEPTTAKADSSAGAGSAAALLAEYADELLELMSSPEADTTLRDWELLPYYHHRCRQTGAFLLVVAEGFHRQEGGDKGASKGGEEGLREGAADTSQFTPHQLPQQQQQGSPSVAVLQAETVLAVTAERLARLFASAVRASGDGAVGSGVSQADEPSLLVSKQTWAACAAEAGRRRRRLSQMLGGDRACRVEAVGKRAGYGGTAALGSGGVRVEATGTGPEDEDGDGEM